MQTLDLAIKAEREKVFALIYGASGTGKTHLLGTLGELGRTLIIDIDKGYQTLVYAPTITNKMRDNLVVTSFDDFKDLEEVHKLIKKNNPKLWAQKLKIDESRCHFDWVAFDTWSEIQWTMLEALREKENLLGDGTLNYRKNIQIQHWGMMTDLNKMAVESFRDCPMNIVFTMQEKMDKDEVAGTVYGGPAIHGKMVQEMPAYFSIVVRTFTNLQGGFVATTKSKGRWPAKNRFAVGEEVGSPKLTANRIFFGTK